MPGGNIWLYQVATLTESGTIQLTEDFSAWDGSLADPSSAETAESLATFAMKNHRSGRMETVINGNAVFSNLQPGLYLLLQTDAAPGYEPISPFLVVLPVQQEIDATPKIQLTTVSTQPLPALPQTGQQKLPVPILGISGLLLVLIGCILRRGFRG